MAPTAKKCNRRKKTKNNATTGIRTIDSDFPDSDIPATLLGCLYTETVIGMYLYVRTSA